ANSSERPALTVVARLRPGMTAANLTPWVDGLLATLDERSGRGPADATGRRAPKAVVTGLRRVYGNRYGSSYPIFLGAVLFVFAVACVNLAGLSLARLSARGHEIGVRMALGATRARVVRQVLTEGMLVALGAGALGLLLAQWGVGLARALPARGIPYWTPFVIDWRVFGFGMVLTAISAAVFGLGPALKFTKSMPNLSMRDAGGMLAGRQVVAARRVLVTIEVAVTLMLLTGAGLLGK